MLGPRQSVVVFALDQRLGRVEFADYLARLDDCLDRGEPFAMVVDGGDPQLEIGELPGRHWQLPRARKIGMLHRGVAFVAGRMDSERVRALNAMQPPGVPYAFFAEREEALEWARAAVEGLRDAAPDRKTRPLLAARY